MWKSLSKLTRLWNCFQRGGWPERRAQGKYEEVESGECMGKENNCCHLSVEWWDNVDFYLFVFVLIHMVPRWLIREGGKGRSPTCYLRHFLLLHCSAVMQPGNWMKTSSILEYYKCYFIQCGFSFLKTHHTDGSMWAWLNRQSTYNSYN